MDETAIMGEKDKFYRNKYSGKYNKSLKAELLDEKGRIIEPLKAGIIIVKKCAGRHSKMSEYNMILLKQCIEDKKMCTVNEVRTLIKEKFDVNYSSKEIREILKKFNLNYYPLIRKYTYESYYNDKILKKFEI